MTSINALFHAFLWLCLSDYVSTAPLRFVYPYNSKSSLRSRKLVVFGDSFSDGGEGAWVVSNNTWPTDPAYYGHRFSNGPVWAQLVANQTELELQDYAVGGATSDNSVVQGYTGPYSTIPVPAAQDQITSYLANHNLTANDIYTIWIGANDAFFSPNVTGTQIAAIVADQVGQLYKNGARNILLPSYPSLAALPFATTQPASVTAFLSSYTEDLKAGLYKIKKMYKSKAHIEVVDIYRTFDQIIADPSKYGLNPAEIHTACLVGAYGEAPRSLCDDPDRHLWFDAYHPTRIGHRAVASVFKKILNKL